jgi:hypothetical protein
MSLSIIIALATAGAPSAPDATILPDDRAEVAATARRMNVPTRALYRGMTAPERQRRAGGIYYCMPRARVVSGKSGMVCRTRQQWARFGLIVPDQRL